MNQTEILERELYKINVRRQDIIRELDNLERLKRKYTDMLKSPKLRRLEKIETGLILQECL